MPIYEYMCQDCKRITELMQKMKDQPPRCEECGNFMAKSISLTNFSLKGDGWFRDGYSKKK